MTNAFVHPTAVVDEGAELGEGAKIWHFCHVMPGARIGERVSLGQGCFVAAGVRIGAGTKVQNHVSIYQGVEIEEDVFVGPSAVFTNVKNPRAFISRMHELESTRVGRGASIGANAVIVCGHDVGAYAFVGAGSVVTHDVPPHALVVGNPARRVGWVSRAGRRLPEGARPVCPETGERYRIDGERCTLDDLPPSPDDPSPPILMVDLVRLHAPIASRIAGAIDRVARSGRFILGDEVERFERAMAEKIGVRHAIGVSSGSDALLASLMALGIGPGDEVITTPFSFFATVEAIVRVGATPVFVDIEESGFHLDPAGLEAAFTDRTRAVLPVHLFGATFDPAIFDLARKRGVPVVEDAAQAFGATSARGHAGALGDLGCFSFFPTKSLGAMGDGGLVTTSNDELAAKVRAIRVHGVASKYHHLRIGGNFRLDALQAAVLEAKLPSVEGWRDRRRAIAARYGAVLAESPHNAIVRPELHEGSAAFAYVVRARRRDELRRHLADHGIATEVYYPEPLHQQPALGLHVSSRRMPSAERACREVLALPIHGALGEAEVERVAAALESFFASHV